MVEQSIEDLLENVWSRREVGIKLPIDTDFLRPITPEDLEYLYNHSYPFLQIVNVAATFDGEIYPNFVTLPNGWVLFDYGDAMCTAYSAKHVFRKNTKDLLKTSSDLKEDDDGSGGEDGGTDKGGQGGDGTGTVIGQQFETALAMIKAAKDKGWQAVELISGNTLMKFYAWIASKELGIEIYGFTPTDEQQKQYNATSKRMEEKKWKWGISNIFGRSAQTVQPK